MPGYGAREIEHIVDGSAQALRSGDVDCTRCDAVCCRLTVVLQSEDRIPPRFTAYTPEGLHVMDRDEEGWCLAIDAARMQCSIYEIRPQICRRFVMAGPYCQEVRADYSDRMARGIPLQLY
ncbi:YkgJ family cysteine cluster protein [Thermomonas carbonis]|uniref:YkgJ family cysteine cluster protein n=1 Tax=Thermomonas carbonis TaxID=1463158 RepID=A0A7G9SN16_9GAMM|nr:YkgJ family cysteine cluster protein [Thermomonas carbonis]QNN69241.1 YkgJ family cysteine cluster protein [Thermomonas carbonis]GHC05773.1 zinc/iron-chelating domain-containing protein [Thermomonas carbonis]